MCAESTNELPFNAASAQVDNQQSGRTSVTCQPYLSLQLAAASSRAGSRWLPPAILKTRASIAGSMLTMPAPWHRGYDNTI